MHGQVALVGQALGSDPYCGDVFVFRSKRHDRIKLLAWDGSGIILATKWLEHGRFVWPPVADGAMCLSGTQLALLLEGLSWSQAVASVIKKPVLAADIVGLATYEPLAWLCPLLGVTRDAINDGGTEEYAALAAVAEHHNALSATLGESPQRFVPIFERDDTGGIDVAMWCRGFHAAIQLNPTFWRALLPARGLAHRWRRHS